MNELHDMMKKAGNWLLDDQDTSIGGWAEQHGKKVNALNTAEAMIALLESGAVAAGDERIQSAVQFLLKHQCRKGSELGSWPREIENDDGSPSDTPDIIRTSFCVDALIKAGIPASNRSLKTSLNWLLGVRNKDGGWGFRRKSDSALTPTCAALLALIEAFGADNHQDKKPIEDGIHFLLSTYHHTDGCFGEAGSLRSAHTISVILVLQAARRRHMGTDIDAEQDGINWLLDHPSEAISFAEETIALDPDRNSRRFDYPYLFMTDALLIRILMGSADSANWNSMLAKQTLISLKKGYENNSGGFYGPRVFSWSTAKALCALEAMTQHQMTFPAPATESEVKSRELITLLMPMVFALIFLIALIVLTWVKGFDWFPFIAFVIVILGCLLFAKKVNQKTFTELFVAVLQLPKSGKALIKPHRGKST